MKIKTSLAPAILFFCVAFSAQAELITPEQSKKILTDAMAKCESISSMSKSLKCSNQVYKDLREAGMRRGTSEYVNIQYASLTDEEIQEQIRLAEGAAKSAEELYQNVEMGELTRDDYLIEIAAAEKLLRERHQSNGDDEKKQ